MNCNDVKQILRCPYKPLVLFSLMYYVNLKDVEANTLIYRYMRGLTQEETAEIFDRSVNTIQNWEKSAIEKYAVAWSDNEILKELLKEIKNS